MGKRSRTKGYCHENEMAKMSREHGFERAERRGNLQAGSNPTDAGDIENVGDLWIEAKHHKRISLPALCKQYLDKDRPGYVNVLVWRSHGVGPEGARATVLFRELLKKERRLCDLTALEARLKAGFPEVYAALTCPLRPLDLDEVIAHPAVAK